ncbi:MAG: zinc ABC transporter substrate-binding protein, partial [Pseudomonadota bacterium]
MRSLKSVLFASSILAASSVSAQAEIKVVASIKPVHSLVAAVMEGVSTPDLIVDGAGSPHTYALKPSQAQALENADVVFWIGHELEAFLEKPLEAIATKAKAVELIDAHDLVKLDLREGGAFDDHAHEGEGEHAEDDHHDHDHEAKAEKDHDHDHDHDKEAKADKDHDHDHDHDKEAKAEKDHDHDHDHEAKAEKDHDHDHDHDKEAKAEKDHDHDHDHEETAGGHEGHDHGEFDVHVWLDPVNAKALVHEIEEVLVEA